MAEAIDRLLQTRIGDYVVVRLVGRATHYTLFQAADPRAGRMVLIKTLHSAGADAPEGSGAAEPSRVLAARLQREADALARLSHPNILAVYETGEQDGYPFLVMEYLYGHPLRQHLDQRSLPLHEAVSTLAQLADAVDAVHAQGILHRDIRPSNVMLLRDGRVKLVDFGLARQPGDVTVTLMGELVGEPSYMAPEQLRNQPASPETDLWAMGVLLYEMLAGEPPFQGSSFPLVAHQVLMGSPAPIPGVSAAIQAVVDRALEKDPQKRYPQARDLVNAFRKAAGSAAEPAPQFELRSRRPLSWKMLACVGAGVLALAAFFLVSLYLAQPRFIPELPTPVPTASAATLPTPAPVTPAPTSQVSPPAPVSSPPPAAAVPNLIADGPGLKPWATRTKAPSGLKNATP